MDIAIIGTYRDFLQMERPIPNAKYIPVSRTRDVFGHKFDYFIVGNIEHIGWKEFSDIRDYLIIHGAEQIA